MSVQERRLRGFSLRDWMGKEGSAYAFTFPYALLFLVFIVIPVAIAVLLSLGLVLSACSAAAPDEGGGPVTAFSSRSTSACATTSRCSRRTRSS